MICPFLVLYLSHFCRRKEKKMSAPSKTEVSELERTNLVKG
jgi:hypothetical protein